MFTVKPLSKETWGIYNEYTEWLNDGFNFEDTSVGMYWTSELNKTVIDEVQECFPENKIMYWNKDTLVMKDGRYYVTIKCVTIGEDSYWTIADIR